MSASGTSGRSLMVLLRNRFEVLFSFSGISGRNLLNVDEAVEEGRVDERFVQMDEVVDERQVVAVLRLPQSRSSSACPMRHGRSIKGLRG